MAAAHQGAGQAAAAGFVPAPEVGAGYVGILLLDAEDPAVVGFAGCVAERVDQLPDVVAQADGQVRQVVPAGYLGVVDAAGVDQAGEELAALIGGGAQVRRRDVVGGVHAGAGEGGGQIGFGGAYAGAELRVGAVDVPVGAERGAQQPGAECVRVDGQGGGREVEQRRAADGQVESSPAGQRHEAADLGGRDEEFAPLLLLLHPGVVADLPAVAIVGADAGAVAEADPVGACPAAVGDGEHADRLPPGGEDEVAGAEVAVRLPAVGVGTGVSTHSALDMRGGMQIRRLRIWGWSPEPVAAL